MARPARARYHPARRCSLMTNDELVIDCDGHILETPDLWERYLEPKYRDRALRIRVGDDGFERLLIDGRPSTIARPVSSPRSVGWARGSTRRTRSASARWTARSPPTRCAACNPGRTKPISAEPPSAR